MTPLNLKNLKNSTVHIFIHTFAGEQPLAQRRPRPAMVAEAWATRGQLRPRRAVRGGRGEPPAAPAFTPREEGPAYGQDFFLFSSIWSPCGLIFTLF